MDESLGLGYGNSSATLRWNHVFSERLTSNLSLVGSRYNYSIDVLFDPYDFNIKAGSDDLKLSYDFSMIWNENNISRFGLASGFVSYKQGELDDRAVLSLNTLVSTRRKS